MSSTRFLTSTTQRLERSRDDGVSSGGAAGGISARLGCGRLMRGCSGFGATVWNAERGTFSALMHCRVLLLLGVFLLTACCAPRSPVLPTRDFFPEPSFRPSYRQLAEGHNRHLEGLDRLWMRASVSINWTEPDGARRFERADDSRLILDLPSNLALAISSAAPGVGTLLWAGTDGERYWLFDLQKENRVWWGHVRNVGRPCSQDLGLPMHPRDTARLLGLLPLDTETSGAVWWEPTLGAWVVEPFGQGFRMVLDHETAFPMRIDLLDESGRSRLISMLNADRLGSRQGQLPPRRADIFLLDSPERVTLEIREADLSPGRRRVNPSQFDLEALLASFEPVEINQLDVDCP